MQIHALCPGSYYLQHDDQALLAGCPPEIVKVMVQRSLKPPGAILLPDFAVSHGESQVSVEFPLYQHAFFGDEATRSVPLQLIGSERRVAAALDLLQLSLFGPDAGQMRAWGEQPQTAEALARESQWFHAKDASGKILPLEKLAIGTVLKDEELDLGWIRIRRRQPNVFRFTSRNGEAQELDLTPAMEQAPPYPVVPDLTPTTLMKLGVEVLGGSTGFSSTQASSGLALCHNGHYLLIDAIPYLNHHLRARGISPNQVQALFLSHIHDDHCNPLPLLRSNRRIQILTTRVIYHMLLRKLALVMDRSEESLQGYFQFLPLTPGEATNFYGLRITPFYSSHSIPTIGATFETTHGGANFQLLFTGDTQSLTDLKRMQRTGVIDQDRYNQIANLYRKPVQLLIADGGEGAIHGDPADALESPAERIVFMHLDKLADKFDAHFCTAASGKRYCVQKGWTDYNLTRTIEFLLEYFPDMPPMWISHLLANQEVIKFNAGDIIIREGSKSQGLVYMMLTGRATVIHHDGVQKHKLAEVEAGEIIGEMSIISGQGVRNASVVAQTPVIITAICEVAFREYVQERNLEGMLKRMWDVRVIMQTLPYIRPLPLPVVRELCLQATLERLPTRNSSRSLVKICPPFSMLMPLGEELILRRNGKPQKIPANGSPILSQPGVTLVSEAAFQYLLLRADQAAKLRARIPAFRYFWEETLGWPVPRIRKRAESASA